MVIQVDESRDVLVNRNVALNRASDHLTKVSAKKTNFPWTLPWWCFLYSATLKLWIQWWRCKINIWSRKMKRIFSIGTIVWGAWSRYNNVTISFTFHLLHMQNILIQFFQALVPNPPGPVPTQSNPFNKFKLGKGLWLTRKSLGQRYQNASIRQIQCRND